jgi:hypothetical protein
MAFPEALADVAMQQLKFWTEPALLHECSSLKGKKRVKEYWSVLGMNLDGCDRDQPWSAAFICWCMDQAGMPQIEFPFSTAHHTYIRWAINNTTKNKPNKTYYGRRLEEYTPKPGDLVAQWRQSKVTFDDQPNGFYPSHCDIVVAVSDTKIETIGGNVSQRVKQTTFKAENGILVPTEKLICVLDCQKRE